jgi:hypothetical protein
MIGASTTLRELAFLVCTAFDDAGETVVLSGGGAATIYAPEAHQSRDLDFIFALWSVDGQVSDGPMRALGFAERGGTYGHPACPYTVEFPAGPLAVGDDSIDTWDTLEEGGNRLHIISPTDCVRDRLAWFFYGRDHSALRQAVAVASAHPIDLDRIARWAEEEGQSALFLQFVRRLNSES